jgi:26S proteasome regulatory subunit N3
MQKISTQNRRALDLVAAKCYYYHARVYEFLDKLDVVRRYQRLRSHYHKTVSLQRALGW